MNTNANGHILANFSFFQLLLDKLNAMFYIISLAKHEERNMTLIYGPGRVLKTFVLPVVSVLHVRTRF